MNSVSMSVLNYKYQNPLIAENFHFTIKSFIISTFQMYNNNILRISRLINIFNVIERTNLELLFQIFPFRR